MVMTGLWLGQNKSTNNAPFSPILGDEPGLAALERTAFAKQFQDRLLTYDQTNFTPGQTALTFLMAEPLRQKQLTELSNRARQRGREFQQTARLRRLQGEGPDRLRAQGSILGKEGSSSWNLSYQVGLELEPSPRSIENPWGWQVHGLEIKTNEAAHPPRDLRVALAASQPALLAFPCFVQNVHTPKDLPVKIKLTSMNVSEVQLHRTGPLNGALEIEARCADRVFKISLMDAAENDLFDLHLQLENEDGLSRSSEQRQRRRGEAYQKTLEDELGFVVED